MRETGECDPELSLVPAIAEIFGITTDELLRGRRNPKEETDRDERESNERRTAQGDKQFRAMLHGRLLKYRNLTGISIGLSVLGLLMAVLFNLAIVRGMIGFCIGTAFLLFSAICQLCFSSNARLAVDPDDDRHETEIQAMNSSVTHTLLAVLTLDVTLLAFFLPLATETSAYTGLVFSYWLLHGGLTAGITLILLGILYVFFLRDALTKRAFLFFDESKWERFRYEKRLLKKTIVIGGVVAVLLGIGITVVQAVGADAFAKREGFDTFEAFKAYTEEHKYDSAYGEVDRYGDIFFENEIIEKEDIYNSENGEAEEVPQLPLVTVPAKDGSTLYEYAVNDSFIFCVEWNFANSDDGLPVSVITVEAMRDARTLYNTVVTLLELLIVFDVLVAAVVYLVKIKRIRREDTEPACQS